MQPTRKDDFMHLWSAKFSLNLNKVTFYRQNSQKHKTYNHRKWRDEENNVFFAHTMLTSRQTKDEGAQLHATAERYKYCWHMMHVGSFNKIRENMWKNTSEHIHSPKNQETTSKLKYLFSAHVFRFQTRWHGRRIDYTIFPKPLSPRLFFRIDPDQFCF